jgi:hypothetical protein
MRGETLDAAEGRLGRLAPGDDVDVNVTTFVRNLQCVRLPANAVRTSCPGGGVGMIGECAGSTRTSRSGLRSMHRC